MGPAQSQIRFTLHQTSLRSLVYQIIFLFFDYFLFSHTHTRQRVLFIDKGGEIEYFFEKVLGCVHVVPAGNKKKSVVVS
jgi:hypothetical protein